MDDALYSTSVNTQAPHLTPLATAAVENQIIKLVIDSLHTRETLYTVYIYCTGLCARRTQSGQSGHNIWFHFSSSSNPILRFYDPYLALTDVFTKLCLISLGVNTVDLLPLALISQSQLSSCRWIDLGLGRTTVLNSCMTPTSLLAGYQGCTQLMTYIWAQVYARDST